MYVCCCKGVSDKVIRAAVREGAHTVEAVGAACGAGTRCGSCRPEIYDLIHDELAAGRRLPMVEPNAARAETPAASPAIVSTVMAGFERPPSQRPEAEEGRDAA